MIAERGLTPSIFDRVFGKGARSAQKKRRA
jgi:hypothetical protein